MHPFRLCDSVMLHKSNLRSYRRPSRRGSDCRVLVMHFVSAIAFMYKVSVKD